MDKVRAHRLSQTLHTVFLWYLGAGALFSVLHSQLKGAFAGQLGILHSIPALIKVLCIPVAFALFERQVKLVRGTHRHFLPLFFHHVKSFLAHITFLLHWLFLPVVLTLALVLTTTLSFEKSKLFFGASITILLGGLFWVLAHRGTALWWYIAEKYTPEEAVSKAIETTKANRMHWLLRNATYWIILIGSMVIGIILKRSFFVWWVSHARLEWGHVRDLPGALILWCCFFCIGLFGSHLYLIKLLDKDTDKRHI